MKRLVIILCLLVSNVIFSNELIKQFEGLYLKSYVCPAGVVTVGYGATRDINNKPLELNTTITIEEAYKLFERDIKLKEEAILSLVSIKLNKNQLDALVSFVYNIGIPQFRRSTMLKLLNKGDYIGASNEFDRWVNAGGRPLKGLILRREAEKVLFLNSVNSLDSEMNYESYKDYIFRDGTLIAI